MSGEKERKTNKLILPLSLLTFLILVNGLSPTFGYMSKRRTFGQSTVRAGTVSVDFQNIGTRGIPETEEPSMRTVRMVNNGTLPISFLFSETSRSTDCSYLNIQAINTTGDLDVRETQNIGISFNALDDSYLTIHCILEEKVLVWQEIFDCPTEGFTQEHRLEFYIDLEKEVLVKEETE